MIQELLLNMMENVCNVNYPAINDANGSVITLSDIPTPIHYGVGHKKVG